MTLRVAFVAGSLAVGGAERHAVRLVDRLAARGHECHVVSIKADCAQAGAVTRARSFLVLGARRYFDDRGLARLAAYFEWLEPQAVVAENGYALMYAWLALRMARSRARLVVVYHSTRLLRLRERAQMLVYRLFFWTSTCAVFLSEHQRRYWRWRGVFAPRNVVIPNGVDADAWLAGADPGERGKVRAAHGFGEADYVIGLCAALRPEKNPVHLVEALASLRNAGIAARVLMIGDGPERAGVEQRARELELDGDVVVTGFRNDVRPYLAACDVVVLCSSTETLSLAAIEAMACARPVIHSRVGGAQELIDPGRNGLTYPVGDVEALASGLARLADRALAERMGRAALATVRARFSEQAMVERYEALLQRLCPSAAAENRQSDRPMTGASA